MMRWHEKTPEFGLLWIPELTFKSPRDPNILNYFFVTQIFLFHPQNGPNEWTYIGSVWTVNAIGLVNEIGPLTHETTNPF